MPQNLDPIYQPIYAGTTKFKTNCLLAGGSLFSPSRPVWTPANLDELRQRFNENPDHSSASFVNKLALQMDGASDNVLLLFAEILWVHFSCAREVSGEKKREHINRLLGWMKTPIEIPADLAAALDAGLASTGVAFNTYRAQQLWFLIDFAHAWFAQDADTVAHLLNDPWSFKAFLFDIPIDSAFIQRNALLHLLHPGTFEPIYSRTNKSDIAKAFTSYIPDDVTDIDRRLAIARAHILQHFETPTDESQYWSPFYWAEVRPIWAQKKEANKETEEQVGSTSPCVWVFAPGAQAFDWNRQQNASIMGIGWEKMGDLSVFHTKEEVEAKVDDVYGGGKREPVMTRRAMTDVRFRIKPGDLVIAKKGRRTILGVGNVVGPYRFNPNETLHDHEFDVEWFHTGQWAIDGPMLPTKTLTDISPWPDFVGELLRTVGLSEDNVLPGSASACEDDSDSQAESYTMDDALSDLFVDEADLTTMVELLRAKKNLVLTGPPGTGKTFLAARLGYLLAEEKSPDRICRVQFHQSMSYEDFVQGYRPSGDGFKRRNGPFVQFCRQAVQDGRPHILLIDEINRGNLSRIFGELMLLIEADKRSEEWATRLAYATDEDRAFWVPENVYIIGTMNTADRSLALVDYALRRRFAFWSVKPAFDHEGLHKHLKENGMNASMVERVVSAMHTLNGRIRSDQNLGDGFCIGHSYFCELDGTKTTLSRLIKTELAPLLREYWFDDPDRARDEIQEIERVV